MIIDTPDSDRQTRLRKAAVLVSTLGEQLAEQLLAELPPRDAEEVRLLVASLDGVDQHELEALLADFKDHGSSESEPMATELSSSINGVELDASLLARIEAEEDLDYQPDKQIALGTWKAISEADTEPLVEMLAAEQPQTIAVVLAHIESEQAAELISRLPPHTQAEVLTRLSQLDPADEQSLQVVESQLADWIQVRRQRQLRISAGRELVDRILQHTPDHQRNVLLAKLGRQGERPIEQDTYSSPTKRRNVPNLPLTTHVSQTSNSRTRLSDSEPTLDNPQVLDELESLDDSALLKALQSVDRQTVMIALAGASDKLMKRLVKGLPRRQATQFRQQVRAIGPTRLSDMVAAQRELVRCGKA